MAMEPGPDRPEENEGPDAENPESWYFDLPSGAWERQEAKNRELRQRVLNNLDDEPARLDPFARRQQPEAKRSGLFGLGKKKGPGEEPRETAGGTFRLAKGGDAPGFGELPRSADFDDTDDDWSTEPELAERLRPGPAAEPLSPTLARGFDHPEDPEPWSEEDSGHPEDAAPAAYVEGPQSISRWADTFGGSDGAEQESELGDNDPLAAMRSWSAKPFATPEPSTAWDHSDEFDDEEPEPAVAAHDLQPTVQADDPEEDAAPLEPDDPISAMRAWAHKSEATPRPFALRPVPVEPEPALPEAAPEPAPELPAARESNFEAPRLGFARRSLEEQEAEESADKGEKWNEMFDSAPEAPGGLSLMAEWAKHKPWDGEGEMPDELLKPFDWELEAANDATSNEPSAVAAEDVASTAAAREAWQAPEETERDDTTAEPLSMEQPEPAAATTEQDWETAPSAWEADEDSPERAPAAVEEPVLARGTDAFDWEREDGQVTAAGSSDEWAHDDELMKDPLIARALAGDVAQPAKEEKKPRGLARFFGRKKKEDPQPLVEAVTGEGDWLPVETGEAAAAETPVPGPVADTSTDWTGGAQAADDSADSFDEVEPDLPVSEWKWPEPSVAETEDAGLIPQSVANEIEDPAEPAPPLWSWQRDDEAAVDPGTEPSLADGPWDWEPNDLPDAATTVEAAASPAGPTTDTEPAAWSWQSNDEPDDADVAPAALVEPEPATSGDTPSAWDWQSNDLPDAATTVEAAASAAEPTTDTEPAAWSWQSNDEPDDADVAPAAFVEPEPATSGDTPSAWDRQSNDLPDAATTVEPASATDAMAETTPAAWSWQSNDEPDDADVAPAAFVEPEPATSGDTPSAWDWQSNDLPKEPGAVGNDAPATWYWHSDAATEPTADDRPADTAESFPPAPEATADPEAAGWSWRSNDEPAVGADAAREPEAATASSDWQPDQHHDEPAADVPELSEPGRPATEVTPSAWDWQSNDLPQEPIAASNDAPATWYWHSDAAAEPTDNGVPATFVEPEPVAESVSAWNGQSDEQTPVEAPATFADPVSRDLKSDPWGWRSNDLPEPSSIIEAPASAADPQAAPDEATAAPWDWQSNNLADEPEAASDDAPTPWHWQSSDAREVPVGDAAPRAATDLEPTSDDDARPALDWEPGDVAEEPAVAEAPVASVEPQPLESSDALEWDWESSEPAEEPVFETPVAFVDIAAENRDEPPTTDLDTPVTPAAPVAYDESSSSPADVVSHVTSWDEPAARDEWLPEPAIEAPAAHAAASEESQIDSPEPAQAEEDDDAWAPEAYETPAASVSDPQPAAVAALDEDAPLPWWEASGDAESEPAAARRLMHALPVDNAAEDEPLTPWWEDEAPDDGAPAHEVHHDQPTPVAQDEPEAAVDDDGRAPATPVAEDDPWAAFLKTRAPAAASQPAEDGAVEAAPEAAAEEDRWSDVFGSASAPQVEEEPRDAWGRPLGDVTAASIQPGGDAVKDDDPWSAIASASGYDAAPPVHEPATDIIASLESKLAEADTVERETASMPPPPLWSVRRSQEATPPPDEPWENDQDVVLRAFEQHAATPDPEPAHAKHEEPETPLTTLFGEDAADIVGEPERQETRAFQRLQGFAPQRTMRKSSDPATAPWEVEEDEDGDHDPTAPIPWGRTSDGALPPPPWGVDPEDNGELRPAPAVQNQSRTKTLVRELVETGLLALLVFLAVRASFQNFKVDGSSMSPTLHDGQFLIVNKLVYSEVNVDKLSNFIPFLDAGNEPKKNVFHGPERGDIVVLVDPRKPDTDLIKRVIGLPGESLQIVDGKVYINDHLLEEPYIKTPWHDNKQKVVIPDGEYFVMGDNRDNSLDSRSTQVGLVPKDLIIGKAMLSYWPSDEFGLAPNGSPTVSQTETVPTVAAQAIDP